jgi:hypothetical protein
MVGREVKMERPEAQEPKHTTELADFCAVNLAAPRRKTLAHLISSRSMRGDGLACDLRNFIVRCMPFGVVWLHAFAP